MDLERRDGSLVVAAEKIEEIPEPRKPYVSSANSP